MSARQLRVRKRQATRVLRLIHIFFKRRLDRHDRRTLEAQGTKVAIKWHVEPS